MINWGKVRKRDEELRSTAASASEALARLRWENTLGATPKVSFAEYGKQCGTDPTNVSQFARAWENLRTCAGSGTDLTIAEALNRAGASDDRAAVIEVMAKSRGVTVNTIRVYEKPETRRIEAIARERAVERGTTVREEAAAIVEMSARHQRAETSQRTGRTSKVDARWAELEGCLMAARRELKKALAVDISQVFEGEHAELLSHSIQVVRDMLALVEMKFIESADIDWDSELQRLTKGAS